MGAKLIDGVAADQVFSPKSYDEIADALRGLPTDDAWLVPVGGGTAITTGNAVDRIPVGMCLSELTGVIEYKPADLTISVNAGTRWSDLIATLAENGQTVPIDVPFPERATVGGVVATGWTGPQRLRDGSIKDLLIGASFVRGDGLAAKAGGMVVKNVSGFEIPRLLHGSYGSLAVITSVNLKVVPLHEAELTLGSGSVPFIRAVDDVLRLTRAEPTVAAAVIDGDGERGEIGIRLSGRRHPIDDLAGTLRSDYGELDLLHQIHDEESARLWQERSDRLASDHTDRFTVEVGSAPADIVEMIERLRPVLADTGPVRYSVSPGIGSATIEIGATAMSHGFWTGIWDSSGASRLGRYVMLDAPKAWRAGEQVWSIPNDQRVIMAALKRQFDPEHRLNRGRLWDAMPVETNVRELLQDNQV